MAPLSTTLLLACSMFLSISHAQEDPTPAPGKDSWIYAGCANETPGRTLNGAGTTNNGTMDVNSCLDFCFNKEFGLAGLEFGSECWCGNALMNGATYNNTGCNMPCTADSSEVCGGANRITVYENTEFTPPQIVPSVGGYDSIGCVTEGTSEHALQGPVLNSPTMTPKDCVMFCKGQGYPYAGVEYSTECYCGNALSNQTSPAPASECNMLCSGDKKSFCGGPNRLVIYQKPAMPARINRRMPRRAPRMVKLY